MALFRTLLIAAAAAATAACNNAPPAGLIAPPPFDEPAPAKAGQQPFVIAANPLAAEAGIDVLKRGGSAVDAAVAVQAMLGLVEPQSSGIGGGGFMTYYDAGSRKVVVYDGREVAPAQASRTMFLDAAGKPLSFATAVLSGRSTGVPGAVKMLAMVQAEHGKRPWSSLFDDARRTASDGFLVSPRLAKLLRADWPENGAPDVKAYFTEADGSLLDVGDRLRNPAYAEFMGRLAAEGPAALYAGSTAAKIVARTHAGALPGTMTMADLAAYTPVKREPLCRPYRAYVICAPPPPSSGVALLQLMGMLEHTDIATRGPDDPQGWFEFAEASRLMYADRNRYVGDPMFVDVPVEGLLDPAYLARRARLIGRVAGPPPQAGTPPGAAKATRDCTLQPTGTSHFIIRDGDGNVVSMTTTVESLFGSGRMVDGFFLNNQLTDFSFEPCEGGHAAPNAVAPGKRPRSSMVPLILLTRDGDFAGAAGSAGGSAILAYVGKTLVGAIDWNLPVQQAIALPNLIASGTHYNGEADEFPPQVIAGLRARGIAVKPGEGEDSGIQAVLIRDGKIDGGFDPRREGVVLTLPPVRPVR